MNSANPNIYGLIGYPVKHSLSPVMHNAAFRCLGINAEYRLFEVKPEELDNFLLKDVLVEDASGQSFSTKDIRGFNITIPHKVRAAEILNREFPLDSQESFPTEAGYYREVSGAVNTVRRNKHRLEYFNTDAPGFLRSLTEDLKFDTSDKNILVIGCGGAGRAVIAALSWKQNKTRKIYINDIRTEAIESASRHFSQLKFFKGFLKNRIEFISGKHLSAVIKDCQLLVNASFAGMKEGDASVVNKELLHRNLTIYDVVYNREGTQLIKDAHSLGLPVIDGLSLLLYQGVAAFEIWTGKPAPVKIMEQALNRAIKQS